MKIPMQKGSVLYLICFMLSLLFLTQWVKFNNTPQAPPFLLSLLKFQMTESFPRIKSGKVRLTYSFNLGSCLVEVSEDTIFCMFCCHICHI